MQKGFKRKFEPIKILNDSQVEQIHTVSLALLEETGFRFENEKGLKLLSENGCIVDYETKIAKIPGFLVEECIRRTPSSFILRARDPEKSMMFGGNTFYFMNSCGARYADVETGTVTMPTMKQNNDAIIVSDALDTVNFFCSYCPYFEIYEVPPVMSCPVSCAQRHRFSSKPSRGAQATDTFIWETQIAQACNAQLLGCVEGAAPLALSEDAINAAFCYLKAGFPIYIASGSVMGGSHPVTIAGALVSHNAEMLAILVLLQCIKPGCGIIANNFVNAMNMQTGDLNFGAASIALHQMAYNQMWQGSYKIPVNNSGSAFSNSKKIDYQTAAEKLPLALTSVLSGTNLLTFHGGITAELAYNPILAVIDDDVANTIGRIIEGFDINDDTLGLDVIKKVGSTGTFLSTIQTKDFWRSENFTTTVFDKTSYNEWISTGKKTIVEKAREKMETIMAEHEPEPLTENQDKEIDKILKEAEEYYKNKNLL